MLRPALLLTGLSLATACIERHSPPIADAPLTVQQAALLDLAFDAASAFPRNPHEKNRARAQETVVVASLELDLPERALRYTGGIENWRQGLAYAEYTLWSVRRGADASQLRTVMDLAAAIGDDPVKTGGQDWRRARIRVRLAESWLTLGDADRAAEFMAGANAAEAGAIVRTFAKLADADAFDRQIAAVDAVILAGDFDAVRHAMAACIELYDRFYADETRRALAEEKVITSWYGMPVDVNLSLRMGLAEAALRHEDPAKALEIVDSAQRLFEKQVWTAVDRIRMRAQLAGLRYRAGDEERARAEAEGAWLAFNLSRDEIVDIERAGVLVPLAEAFLDLGDRSEALALYLHAAEEARINPNSRPRCDDLVAICCSLAIRNLQPDTALDAKLYALRDSLGDPW